MLLAPSVAAARSAPRAELVRLLGGHDSPYLDGHGQAVAAEPAFLGRHLLPADTPLRPAGTTSG